MSTQFCVHFFPGLFKKLQVFRKKQYKTKKISQLKGDRHSFGSLSGPFCICRRVVL